MQRAWTSGDGVHQFSSKHMDSWYDAKTSAFSGNNAREICIKSNCILPSHVPGEGNGVPGHCGTKRPCSFVIRYLFKRLPLGNAGTVIQPPSSAHVWFIQDVRLIQLRIEPIGCHPDLHPLHVHLIERALQGGKERGFGNWVLLV